MKNDRLALAPDIALRLTLAGDIELVRGEGGARASCVFDSHHMVAWLALFVGGMPLPAAIASAEARLGLDTSEAEALVEELIERGVLVAGMAAVPARWPARDAHELHRATRNVPFESSAEAPAAHAAWQTVHAERLRAGNDEPEPPRHKRMSGPIEHLTEPRLAALVRTCFQVQGTFDFPHWGRHYLKTSPSLGARHPVEAYLVRATGLYHVAMPEGAPVRIATGDLRAPVATAARLAAGAPSYCILTLDWARFQWKYRDSRYYEMAMYDLGHVAGTLRLCAGELGIQITLSHDLDDSALAKLLGVSDLDESPMLVVALI